MPHSMELLAVDPIMIEETISCSDKMPWENTKWDYFLGVVKSTLSTWIADACLASLPMSSELLLRFVKNDSCQIHPFCRVVSG